MHALSPCNQRWGDERYWGWRLCHDSMNTRLRGKNPANGLITASRHSLMPFCWSSLSLIKQHVVGLPAIISESAIIIFKRCFSLALPIEQTLKELSIQLSPNVYLLFSRPIPCLLADPQISRHIRRIRPRKRRVLPPFSSCGASWISGLRLIPWHTKPISYVVEY